MPGFLRLARSVHSLQAMSLVGVDVHDDWMVDVLDFGERVDQRVDIVAVRHIPVVETEITEQVVFRCAVGGAQFGEPLVDAAMVGCNGHFVVVDDDDEVGGHLARVVEAFERFAFAERAVADERDDVLRAPAQVTPLGHAHRHGDGSAGVPYHEMVVFAFLRARIAGEVVVVGRVEECLFAPG